MLMDPQVLFLHNTATSLAAIAFFAQKKLNACHHCHKESAKAGNASLTCICS